MDTHQSEVVDTRTATIAATDCPACGDEPTIHTLTLYDYDDFCGIQPGSSPSDPEGSPADDDFPTRVTPSELVALLDGDEPPLLVDVRERWEWDEGNLEGLGAVHLPLGELSRRMDQLPRDRPVVALCSVGARSAGVADYLRDRGFARVANLAGGLAAWAEEQDPGLVVV